MNIQYTPTQLTVSNPPKFTGKLMDKAFTVLSDKKVCNKMTNLDFISTQMYIKSLAYKMGITPEEVAELSKFDGVEFFANSYNFLLKKLGLAEEISPPLQLIPEIKDSPLFAMYIPSYNQILVDLSKVGNLDKQYLFAALRHELQHFIQAADIHRHETLAPKIADVITDQFITSEKKTFDYILENLNDEQIKAIYAEDPSSMQLITAYKTVCSLNDDAIMADFWNQRAIAYRQNVDDLQKNIQDKLGVIKADSALTPRIERNLEEFENSGYFNADGSLNMKKYLDAGIEDEAIIAQIKAQHEFEGVPCGVRKLKEETFADIKRKEAAQDANL